MLEQVGSLIINICASFTSILFPESGMKSEIEANRQNTAKRSLLQV